MSNDLFEGVKVKDLDDPPKPESAATPAPPDRKPAAAAGGQETSGVPLTRLLGWAAPLLFVVIAIVLWQISGWLLLIAVAAAAAGLLVWALVRAWQKRHGSRGGRGRSGLFGPGGWGGAARSPGLGLGGSGGRRSGPSRLGGLFRRGGRGGVGGGSSHGGRQAAGAEGRGRSGRQGRGLRGLFSGKKGSGSSTTSGGGGGTATGKRANGGGNGGTSHKKGRQSAGGSHGPSGSRWSRSRANPTTWFGSRRAAAKGERAAAKDRRAESKSDKQEEKRRRAESKADKQRGKDKKRKDRPEGKKSPDDTEKPETDGKKPKKSKGKPKPKGSEDKAGVKPKVETPAAPKESPKAPVYDCATPEGKKPETEGKKPKAEAKPEVETPAAPKESPKAPAPATEDFPYDDMGFPLGRDSSYQSRPRPPKPNLNFDDGGFLSPRGPKPPAPKTSRPNAPRTPNNTSTQGSNRMSVTERTTNEHVDKIDASTMQSFRQSLQETAEALNKEGMLKEEEAGELRRQAAEWQEKGNDAAAEPLLREAAGLEETAQERYSAAAAYLSV
jgi:hypothetical protein